jgi:hypothetical protein
MRTCTSRTLLRRLAIDPIECVHRQTRGNVHADEIGRLAGFSEEVDDPHGNFLLRPAADARSSFRFPVGHFAQLAGVSGESSAGSSRAASRASNPTGARACR